MRCLTNVYTPGPPPLHNNPYTIMHSVVLIPILSRYLTTYALGPTKVPRTMQANIMSVPIRIFETPAQVFPTFQKSLDNFYDFPSEGTYFDVH